MPVGILFPRKGGGRPEEPEACCGCPGRNRMRGAAASMPAGVAEFRGEAELATIDVVAGQIGYGYWGPNLARNLMELDGVRLKYICDPSRENLSNAAARCPGVELAGETELLLEDEEVTAVVIASPARTHFELAEKALRAGKHVFVEKPTSLSLAEGRGLVETVNETGLVLMVGHLFVYHPAVRLIKEYISSGSLGRVFYLYSQRLNLGRLRRDENCLWSLAPHDISIMLHLLDSEPDSIVARGASYLQEGLEDVVFLTLYFPDGQTGNIHVSWLDPQKVRSVTVVGSEKMVVFDDMSAEKVKIFDRKVSSMERELK